MDMKYFQRQLHILAKNDCFISYSTSGESENIINAIDCANSLGIKTIFYRQEKSRVSEKSSLLLGLLRLKQL